MYCGRTRSDAAAANRGECREKDVHTYVHRRVCKRLVYCGRLSSAYLSVWTAQRWSGMACGTKIARSVGWLRYIIYVLDLVISANAGGRVLSRSVEWAIADTGDEMALSTTAEAAPSDLGWAG
jgi:hypothetical protein